MCLVENGGRKKSSGEEEATATESYSTATADEVSYHANHFAKLEGGGFEHLRQWHQCISQANTKGANVKNHVLGFLGMYNISALLVFTIAYTGIYSMGPITEWIDAILFFLYTWSAWFSFSGMSATTICYNAASAVSDANAIALIKMPAMAKYLSLANDMCLQGALPLAACLFCFAAKYVYIPFGQHDTEESSYSAITMVSCDWFKLSYFHFCWNTPLGITVRRGGKVRPSSAQRLWWVGWCPRRRFVLRVSKMGCCGRSAHPGRRSRNSFWARRWIVSRRYRKQIVNFSKFLTSNSLFGQFFSQILFFYFNFWL